MYNIFVEDKKKLKEEELKASIKKENKLKIKRKSKLLRHMLTLQRI